MTTLKPPFNDVMTIYSNDKIIQRKYILEKKQVCGEKDIPMTIYSEGQMFWRQDIRKKRQVCAKMFNIYILLGVKAIQMARYSKEKIS